MTEQYLYDTIISKLTVDMYEWTDSGWNYIYTRDFKYQSNWYAKKFLYTTGLDFESIIKPNGKVYAEATIGASQLMVGMEEDYDGGDLTYNDLILCIGANDATGTFFKCTLCGTIYNGLWNKCSCCSSHYSVGYDLIFHCSLCGRTYPDEWTGCSCCASHYTIGYTTKWKCDYCGQIHSYEPTHPCYYCANSYYAWMWFRCARNHYWPTQTQPSNCPYCGTGYIQHVGDMYQCAYCSKWYYNTWPGCPHSSYTPFQIPYYTCDLCGRRPTSWPGHCPFGCCNSHYWLEQRPYYVCDLCGYKSSSWPGYCPASCCNSHYSTFQGPKCLTFIDSIMGGGAFRKVVYRTDTGEKLFDYPSEKQKICSDSPSGFTFEDTLYPEEEPNGDGGWASGDDDWSYIDEPVPYTMEDTRMRLCTAVYYPQNGEWVKAFTKGRYEEDNPNKWFFKIFHHNERWLAPEEPYQWKIISEVIGFEDNGDQSRAVKDSYWDLVMVLVHEEKWYFFGGGMALEYVRVSLDMVQCTGCLRKEIGWEVNGFGLGGWTSIFGEYGYQAWEYNIVLYEKTFP